MYLPQKAHISFFPILLLKTQICYTPPMSKFRKQHMSINWDNLIDVESQESAKNAPLHEKAILVGRLGLLMLSVGAGAYRVRAAMNKVSRAMGITCTADIGLLSIEYTCVEGSETYTNALSINTTGVNTDKLSHLRAFADNFVKSADRYSLKQFFEKLDEIEHTLNHYGAIKLAFASALACASFTFLLGGGIVEMICAFFGAGMGNFVRKKLLEKKITLFANVALGVASACLVYIACIKAAEFFFGISDAHQAGYICSMLFVIPGFPLITGGIDLAKLDLRSGMERIMYALLIIFVATITGWVCAWALHFRPADFLELNHPEYLMIIFRAIASFLAVLGFSLMFNSPLRMAVTAGIIGMVSNVFRLELIEFTGIPIYIASFLASLIAGLLASATKKLTGYPRLTITVPSIVIMVPGMYMYKGVYYMALEEMQTGGMWLSKAILVICSLSLGLIAARIITDKNFRTSS